MILQIPGVPLHRRGHDGAHGVRHPVPPGGDGGGAGRGHAGLRH